MLSRTSQYALQAMIHVARHSNGEPRSCEQIAEQAGIPKRYLSTILGELAQAGMLDSTRGKGGGFRLARPSLEICLYDIVVRFEPVLSSQRSCPFGNTICGDENPCLAHHDWKKIIEAEQRFLHSTTLRDVATEKRHSSDESVKKEGTSDDALTIS